MKASYYAKQMDTDYGRITVREQKTRWGSCSSKGNLNFNWKLMMMPEPIIDYVVIHELAHRKHMDHSKNFWLEVEKVLPDYRIKRDWLRKNGRLYTCY
jgi:predicted metal-dependent hydrolase